MTVRTQNLSQLVVFKLVPSKGRHKMYPYQNESQHELIKPIPLQRGQRGHKIHINRCWQTYPMPTRTQYVSQRVLRLHRGHKIHRNKCWRNPSHASEHTKCISKCANETSSIPARTQNIYQIVLNIPCQRGHKIDLNLCWTNISNASGITKYILPCVDQTYPMPAKTQNLSQHELIKPLSCRKHEKYLNLS